ncbi:MAG: hypothetical protein E6R08_09840 [Nevskiaceae bacterium]|nr:MAG: hypothetical protein E6R08_09840 [Nevskiaceae bacterium]
MSIEIKIYGEDAGHALRELRDFSQGLTTRGSTGEAMPAVSRVAEIPVDDEHYGKGANLPAAAETAPQRERGKPAQGRARRTKEEIAEDEAADRADAAKQQSAVEANLQDDVKASISTGENRVGPEDDAETQAQDAADEAAESAAKSDGKVTHDHLRQALGDYQKKFGMAAAVRQVAEGGLVGCTVDKVREADLPAVIAKVRAAIDGAPTSTSGEPPADTTATRDDVKALMIEYQKKYGDAAVQEDGPRIFKSALGDVPPGTKNASGMEVSQWSLGAVPNDPTAFAKCVTWWKTAINQAPEAFGRKAVA